MPPPPHLGVHVYSLDHVGAEVYTCPCVGSFAGFDHSLGRFRFLHCGLRAVKFLRSALFYSPLLRHLHSVDFSSHCGTHLGYRTARPLACTPLSVIEWTWSSDSAVLMHTANSLVHFSLIQTDFCIFTSALLPPGTPGRTDLLNQWTHRIPLPAFSLPLDSDLCLHSAASPLTPALMRQFVTGSDLHSPPPAIGPRRGFTVFCTVLLRFLGFCTCTTCTVLHL